MCGLMAYSELKIAEARKTGQIGEIAHWLCFRAFTTTGFTLRTR